MKFLCSSDALDLYAVSTRKKAAFVEHIVGRPSFARFSLGEGTPTPDATGCSRELDDGLRRVVVPAAAIGAGGMTSSIRRYHQSLGSVLAAWRLWTRPRAEENVIVILHPPTQRVLTLIRR